MSKERLKIDFIGIGFTRCATTWVYENLKKHPEVCVSNIKETNFFKNKVKKNKLHEYSSFFSHCGQDKTKGEFSPTYVNSKKARKNIKKFFPEAKLIFTIRDPVNRAISLFLYGNKHGAIKIDEERLIEQWKEKEHYYSKFKKWIEDFPRENIKIVKVEEIQDNPEATISQLYNFLGVDEDFIPSGINKKENQAHRYYLPGIHRILNKLHKKLKRKPQLLRFLNSSILIRTKNWLSKVNRKNIEKPKVSSQTRLELRKGFREEIKKLEKLTDKDLQSWK